MSTQKSIPCILIFLVIAAAAYVLSHAILSGQQLMMREMATREKQNETILALNKIAQSAKLTVEFLDKMDKRADSSDRQRREILNRFRKFEEVIIGDQQAGATSR